MPLNTIWQKATSVQPCTHTHTKENSSETNLQRLALGDQMVKNLHALVHKFELNQSERKLSQECASHRQNAQVM